MRRRSFHRPPIRLAIVVAAFMLVTGCSENGEGSATARPSVFVTASSSAGPSPPGATRSPASSVSETRPPSSVDLTGELTLDQLLALLATAPEQRAGYDRSLFKHWIDADGDGCDTRREVLIDEAVVPPTVGGGCSLFGGSWLSLYDGLTFTDPIGMDIDHVVALGEAWDSGAYSWTPERRERFANDLDVTWALIAVSAGSNRSKSDKDPADWLPPSPADRCPFAAAWIAIKVRWELAVNDRERIALASLALECPEVRMPIVPAG